MIYINTRGQCLFNDIPHDTKNAKGSPSWQSKHFPENHGVAVLFRLIIIIGIADRYTCREVSVKELCWCCWLRTFVPAVSEIPYQ